MLNGPLSSVTLILTLTGGLMGQTLAPYPGLADADQAAEGLRQVSRELTVSLKSFYRHLDDTLSRHDRGYQLDDAHRSDNRAQIQGADVDLTIGPADLMFAAIRKLATFRMLVARNARFQPAPAVDLDHIQKLLEESRQRVDASTSILRSLLLVPAAELDWTRVAAVKAARDRLLQARAAAEDTARQALLALPIEQPETNSQEETAQRAWDYLNRRLQAPKEKSGKSEIASALQPAAFQQRIPAIPVRFERRKRITLINEASYRMAITDSGIEDPAGRHIFYQEEWVQRGMSVLRFRWRVAVETITGEHILLKRYPALELHGGLEDLYSHGDRDYLWYIEPPDDSPEPALSQIEFALSEVARSRETIRAAAQDFKAGIREALARQDQLHAAAGEPATDSGLPDGMRQTLFAIRAHLAGVLAILQLENNVRQAISRAGAAVRNLEPLAAWSNRPAVDSDRLLDRSDREIDSVRTAETEALALLPQDTSAGEARFPALAKNVIVRIRRTHSRNPQDQSVRCLQELWWMEGGLGTREVRRTVNLILIEPRTGNQTRVGAGMTSYKASPEDLLEEIFDEYAADEVSLGG